MKIQKQAKTDMYYLLFFWSIKELFEGNIFFVNKDIAIEIRKKSHLLVYKKQKQNNKVKKETIKLLNKIQKNPVPMERLSYEMIMFLSLNYLMNEIEDKDIKKTYKDIDVIFILDGIRKKYPDEMKEHYKFFDILEEEI